MKFKSLFLYLISFVAVSQQSPIVFTQLYNINNVPINQDTASCPAVNNSIPFPFGQKNDLFALASVQQGLAPFALISKNVPLDAPHVSRIGLPAMSLSKICGNTFSDFINLITKNQPYDSPLRKLAGKDPQIIPAILYIKKDSGLFSTPAGIVGIELNFPSAEQAVFGGITRIGFVFIQYITQNTRDNDAGILGINALTLTSGSDYAGTLIMNQEQDQKEYLRSLIREAFNNAIKNAGNKLTSAITKKIGETLESLTTYSIGFVIDQPGAVRSNLKQETGNAGLSQAFLEKNTYIVWNANNRASDNLVHIIQQKKMPIASNYYLFGTIMGYTEEHIKLRYQIEGYLRANDRVYADGTVAWPYNIPKWGIENGIAFNAWLKDKWDVKLYLLSSEKYKRKQYEEDKKNAQKYIKDLPLSLSDAIKQLKDKPQPTTKPSTQNYTGLTTSNKESSTQPKTNVDQVTQSYIDNKIGGIKESSARMDKESIQKELEGVSDLFEKALKQYKKDETGTVSFNETYNDMVLLVKNDQLKNDISRFITTPISIIESTQFTAAIFNQSVEDLFTQTLTQSAPQDYTQRFTSALKKEYANNREKIKDAQQKLGRLLKLSSPSPYDSKNIKTTTHTLKYLLIGLIATEGLEIIGTDLTR